MFRPVAESALSGWEQLLGDGFFLIALVFLAFELIRYAVKKRFSWNLAADTVTNFITLAFYIGLGFLIYGAFYVSSFVFLHQFALFDIGISWATVIICVVLADLAYYWEHRFLHRVGLGWATHTVHHSSPNFNISVAYRFGPMDDLWPILFYIPLVLVGFNPFVVFFAAMFVQIYQTALHTEVIGKLPRFVEAVMNTPSHHRVHHGSNDKYIDKNYAGVFIVWDRMFGTFAEEDETVVYGITTPVDSVNPFVVFFHGLGRLWREVRSTPGVGNKFAILIKPPGWAAEAAGVRSTAHSEGGAA